MKRVERGCARMRLFVKDHKSYDEVKGRYPTRPVLFGMEAMDYKLAKIMDWVLKGMLVKEAGVYRGARKMIEEMKELCAGGEVEELVKADVKALFPSISQDDCVEKVNKFLRSDYDENMRGKYNMTIETLMEVVKALVVRPIVQVGTEYYSQKVGVMIGNPAALPLAEVYLEMIEREGEERGLDRRRFLRYCTC